MYTLHLLKLLAETKLKTHKVTAIVNPATTEAASLIAKAFAQRRTLVVAGNCHVHYAGRAQSTLEPGERLLIIKKDGSLLVHRPTGYEPVNWQPSGSIFHVQRHNNTLEVTAVRQKPREKVKVTFNNVFMVSILNLDDSGEFMLYSSEQDMHRAILLKPSLIESGFKPISYEKKVQPGFVDVYGEDKEGNLVVVEVKRKTAGKEAAFQLFKYIKAIREKTNRSLRGILAAPSLGKDVQRLLETLELEFKALDPKECSRVLNKAGTTKLESFIK